MGRYWLSNSPFGLSFHNLGACAQWHKRKGEGQGVVVQQGGGGGEVGQEALHAPVMRTSPNIILTPMGLQQSITRNPIVEGG